MRKGICSICEKVGTLFSCQTCGTLACSACIQGGICINCRKGRQGKK